MFSQFSLDVPDVSELKQEMVEDFAFIAFEELIFDDLKELVVIEDVLREFQAVSAEVIY